MSMTELQAMSRSLFKRPLDWPSFPIIAVKKWDEKKHSFWLGYIHIDDLHSQSPRPYKIRQGNPFAPNPQSDPVISEFATVDDLIAHGWLAD